MKTPDDEGGEGPLAGTWYADRFKIGQNAFEFKIDCGHETAEEEFMTVYYRVIANPVHAQQLFRLMWTALLHYRDTSGLIGASTATPRSKP